MGTCGPICCQPKQNLNKQKVKETPLSVDQEKINKSKYDSKSYMKRSDIQSQRQSHPTILNEKIQEQDLPSKYETEPILIKKSSNNQNNSSSEKSRESIELLNKAKTNSDSGTLSIKVMNFNRINYLLEKAQETMIYEQDDSLKQTSQTLTSKKLSTSFSFIRKDTDIQKTIKKTFVESNFNPNSSIFILHESFSNKSDEDKIEECTMEIKSNVKLNQTLSFILSENSQ